MTERTIETWVIRPVYKIRKNKKKFKIVEGMVIAKDKQTALRLSDEYVKSGLDAPCAYETITIKEEE